MTPTRTYEALVTFINTEFDKLEKNVNSAIDTARKDAGTEDAFDVTLALANKLNFYALKLAVQMHDSSLEISRTHETRQLDLPFPPN
jgi:hypothetical protein